MAEMTAPKPEPVILEIPTDRKVNLGPNRRYGITANGCRRQAHEGAPICNGAEIFDVVDNTFEITCMMCGALTWWIPRQ